MLKFKSKPETSNSYVKKKLRIQIMNKIADITRRIAARIAARITNRLCIIKIPFVQVISTWFKRGNLLGYSLAVYTQLESLFSTAEMETGSDGNLIENNAIF